jgi:hypothetical protein
MLKTDETLDDHEEYTDHENLGKNLTQTEIEKEIPTSKNVHIHEQHIFYKYQQ